VLTKSEIENILTETSIDKKRRGETLTLEEFAKLSMAMGNKLLSTNASSVYKSSI